MNEPPLLPIGTHVVVRLAGAGGDPARPAGAVATIVSVPADPALPYGVRFPDGGEASLLRAQMSIRRPARLEALALDDDPAGRWNLRSRVIYQCVVGSRAFGLDGENSDTDRRGIYLAPADLQWSLFGAPEQLEYDDSQECYWELGKFLILALKANPNALECLYSPLVEAASPLAQELLAMRSMFLTRLVYQTFNGYALSQFKKMEQDLRATGEVRWKHAMHLLRLLISGATALREGFIPIRQDEHRERLLSVRRGELPWAEVEAWRLELHRKFDEAWTTTALPERPDVERANAFLIRARRLAASE